MAALVPRQATRRQATAAAGTAVWRTTHRQAALVAAVVDGTTTHLRMVGQGQSLTTVAHLLAPQLVGRTAAVATTTALPSAAPAAPTVQGLVPRTITPTTTMTATADATLTGVTGPVVTTAPLTTYNTVALPAPSCCRRRRRRRSCRRLRPRDRPPRGPWASVAVPRLSLLPLDRHSTVAAALATSVRGTPRRPDTRRRASTPWRLVRSGRRRATTHPGSRGSLHPRCTELVRCRRSRLWSRRLCSCQRCRLRLERHLPHRHLPRLRRPRRRHTTSPLLPPLLLRPFHHRVASRRVLRRSPLLSSPPLPRRECCPVSSRRL